VPHVSTIGQQIVTQLGDSGFDVTGRLAERHGCWEIRFQRRSHESPLRLLVALEVDSSTQAPGRIHIESYAMVDEVGHTDLRLVSYATMGADADLEKDFGAKLVGDLRRATSDALPSVAGGG
jgi:hypothetical protein